MSKSTGEGSTPPWSLLAGVLFDSGDVLMRPTSPNDAPATEAWRRWFGGPRFVAAVNAHLPGLRLDGADQAFAAGMRYLDDRHRHPLRTVAEERERFTGFSRIVLEALGVQDPPPALLQELVHAFVISSQEGRLKEDSELFAIAAARMGCPPRRCCSSMTGRRTSRPLSRPASGAPSSIATRRRPPFPGSGT